MNNEKNQIQGVIKMNARPRMKILALSIGLALSQLAAEAMADSAVGVDTVMGNASNPGGVNPVAQQAEGARDPDASTTSRTPSGQLYNIPYAAPEVKAGGDVSASIEVGVIHSSGNPDAALNSMYRDTKTGNAGVNSFSLNIDNKDSAMFMEATGGNPGTHDQFSSVQFGKYNDWKMKLFYNETKHIFTSTWKSLYSGEGTGNLTTGLAVPQMMVSGTHTAGDAGYVGATSTCTAALPCWSYNGKIYSNAKALAAINGFAGTYDATGALIAGSAQSNQAADIATKLANTPYSELSLIRAKGGARFDKNLDGGLKVYASYTNEQRNGARPFAMNESNFSTEIAEPIKYTTHDWLAGLSYVEGVNRANLKLSVTNFRNDIKQLDVQYPMLQVATPMGAINTATFALAPDNDAFNLKGDFARDLPDFYHGKFTAAASYGSNRQNDTLLMPISAAQSAELTANGVSTIVGVANPGYTTAANVNDWNGVNGSPLSQAKANQRIDNTMLNLGLSLKPTDDLGVKGSLRSYKTDNKGGYLAYNPLTNQFGRGFTDNQGVARLEVITAGLTQGGACYTPPGYAPVAGCVFNPGGAAAAGAVFTGLGNNSPILSPARSTRAR